MNAGLGRRFAALAYDALLIVALLMVYTAIALFFTHGNAIVPEVAGAWAQVYYAGEVSVIAGYYVFCCHLTGHTLGMRAWRLRAQTPNGELLSLPRALLRFALGLLAWAPLGAGVLWLYADRDGMAAQDRLSGTRVVQLT